MMRPGALILVVLWLVMLGAPSRVRFIRPPVFVHEGQSLRFTVWVEPHPDDRRLIVAAADPECTGSLVECSVSLSTFALGGPETSRKAWDVRWGALPHGEFRVVAVVFDSQREVARASVPVIVLARGPASSG